MTETADNVGTSEGGSGSETPSPTATSAAARVCPLCDEAYPADFVVCPRDGARLEDVGGQSTDPLIGTVLDGAFRILREIGEGATARVYEASHVRLGKKRFAVKVLNPFYGAEPTALARFQREAAAAASIEHPGVVDVYDINRTADGRMYLVTELLEGRDLAALLEERGKLDVPLAVQIASELCRALAAAHALGIVHRDMKPDNVFVSGALDAPSIKVLDFGISKIDDGANLTRTGMLVGTPAYMAPEQAAGGKIDARTDIYAVGAILYRSLTGRKAFVAEDTAEVLSAILTEEPARPRSLEPSIPEALELVIQRAMSKQPEARHASALELERALAPFASQEASAQPGADADTVRDGREAKRARPLLIVATVLSFAWVIGVLDAGALALLSEGDTDGQLRLARLVFVTLAVLLIVAAPMALFVRFQRRLWQNTPKTMELARRMKTALIAAAGSYAAMAVAVRVVESVTAGRIGFGPAVDLGLGVASFAAAGIAVLATAPRSSR
jgi:serine/threonine-protein kinase